MSMKPAIVHCPTYLDARKKISEILSESGYYILLAQKFPWRQNGTVPECIGDHYTVSKV